MSNVIRTPLKRLTLVMLMLALSFTVLSPKLVARTHPRPRPDKVIYCSYQGCPTGQTCWYCHQQWVCIWNYPDPTQVPPGCSGGPV
jgi:hypothetical protein